MKTIRQYRPYWQELGRFAVKLGDFQTAAICDDDLRPAKPLPANPDTIMLWIHYKSYGKGVRLLKPRSSTDYATYPDGQVIEAIGGWNADVNIRRARTAINMLHKTFELCRGAYAFACEKCFTSNSPIDWTKGGTWLSCADHTSGALLRASGNPTSEKKCSAAFAEARNFLKAKHTVRGNVQLNPSQVRQIRDRLFTSDGGGNMYHMQTYLLMILGIKLFLRADEVIKLRFDNFQMDAAEVEFAQNRVDSLVVWVEGKSDKEKVFLRIYRDDDNPVFCPIRHLLCYLQATGIKGGFLFPQWDLLKAFLDSPSSGDGVFETHLTYENFLDRVQVRNNHHD